MSDIANHIFMFFMAFIGISVLVTSFLIDNKTKHCQSVKLQNANKGLSAIGLIFIVSVVAYIVYQIKCKECPKCPKCPTPPKDAKPGEALYQVLEGQMEKQENVPTPPEKKIKYMVGLMLALNITLSTLGFIIMDESKKTNCDASEYTTPIVGVSMSFSALCLLFLIYQWRKESKAEVKTGLKGAVKQLAEEDAAAKAANQPQFGIPIGFQRFS